MLRTSLRALAAGLLITSLGACTAVFSDVASTWEYATQEHEDASLNQQEISEFPYTAVYIRRGDAPRALVVLGFVDDAENEQTESPAYFNWITEDKETLVTQHGRLVRTDQLNPELIGRTQLAADPLRCFGRALKRSGFSGLDDHNCKSTWHYAMDIDGDVGQYSVAVRSDFSVGEREVLSLPQAKAEVIKITEQVHFSRSRVGEQKVVTNQFWIEQDGHVVKSIQTIAPHQAAFEITQVKWVGREYE